MGATGLPKTRLKHYLPEASCRGEACGNTRDIYAAHLVHAWCHVIEVRDHRRGERERGEANEEGGEGAVEGTRKNARRNQYKRQIKRKGSRNGCN